MSTIAIVGRPNVGKSTLFNRILGYHKAIVEDLAGVSRDRNIAVTDWEDRRFILIDTGGFEPEAEESLKKDIARQVMLATQEADLLLFMVDGREGLSGLDEDIARKLLPIGKPIILVVNKVDNDSREEDAVEFHRLGIDPIICVSAEHKKGIGDLLDAAMALCPTSKTSDPARGISLAIIGRPNVGKSSLVNKLLGAERVIVSEVPGTTRDSIDTPLKFHGQDFTLIDTAGIRRRGKVEEKLERLSVIHAMKNLERADIAVLLIDAIENITDQDTKIAGLAEDSGRGIILAVNKWDAIEKDNKTHKAFEDTLRERLKFLPYAPIVTISALMGQRVNKILEVALEIAELQQTRIPTPDLNRLLDGAYRGMPPPKGKGAKPLKLYYAAQVSSKPPTFVIKVNDPAAVHFSYKRYLINQIRKAHPYQGLPIRLIFRPRHKTEGAPAPKK